MFVEALDVTLNTSVNENEPVVNTPAQALDCFVRTKMDLLVMCDDPQGVILRYPRNLRRARMSGAN